MSMPKKRLLFEMAQFQDDSLHGVLSFALLASQLHAEETCSIWSAIGERDYRADIAGILDVSETLK